MQHLLPNAGSHGRGAATATPEEAAIGDAQLLIPVQKPWKFLKHLYACAWWLAVRTKSVCGAGCAVLSARLEGKYQGFPAGKYA